MDDFFMVESQVMPDTNDEGHGVPLHDNEAWKRRRQEWLT
jgi:hypothetical protein